MFFLAHNPYDEYNRVIKEREGKMMTSNLILTGKVLAVAPVLTLIAPALAVFVVTGALVRLGRSACVPQRKRF